MVTYSDVPELQDHRRYQDETKARTSAGVLTIQNMLLFF